MCVTISIIIPVYNTAQYLEECLDSVLAQHYKDWECLLIDDGSTDGSSDICDSYASRDDRFKVCHAPNCGASFARNMGIKYSSGTYIVFIDSDDKVDEGYLLELYSGMMQVKPELVVCGMKLVRPSGIEINTVKGGLITIGSEDADRFVELNRKSLLYGPVVKLYRSDIIKDNHIKFPLGVHYGEDLMFNFKYLEYVTRILVIESSGYNYRILSEGSLSSSIHSRNISNNYRHWKIIRSFFNNKGIDSPDAQIYLSNRLWGIAYNLVMNDKLSVKEIKDALHPEFITDLKAFHAYTITVPRWLELSVREKMYLLIWLKQRIA